MERKEVRTFALLDSAALPIEQRTRADLFVYALMEYIKPALSITDQLTALQLRGLTIPDLVGAEQFLKSCTCAEPQYANEASVATYYAQ